MEDINLFKQIVIGDYLFYVSVKWVQDKVKARQDS
jgi:hypothetical protein